MASPFESVPVGRLAELTGIDTANTFVVSVGVGRADVVLFAPPRPGERLTTDQALVLAAWIVAMADPGGERFPRLLEEVRGS